jgi:thiamine biosynthesis lipoprotein
MTLAAEGPPDDSAVTARARFLMGTRLALTLPARTPEATFEAAFDEVARLEDVMSNWRATSEISRLNRAAARTPFRCSPDLFGAIDSALDYAAGTGGAFDPTVEPLVRALGLRGPEGRLPGDPPETTGEEAPAAGRTAAPGPIGWRHVRLDRRAHTVRFDREGVGLDLGGIGKGIALDAAAHRLVERGVGSALLDFGGQILALGSPPAGGSWPVDVAAPGDRARPVLRVRLRDRSLSTSGDDERSIAGPGGPIGHILDPARGRPAGFPGSVTVAARDATGADALSTGLFVMGPEAGIAWAERRGVAVLYLVPLPGGRVEPRESRAFRALLDSAALPEGARRESGEGAGR